jgi:hypothetical protein
MITVSAPRPRAERVTCADCGLAARPPIIVAVGKTVGRCADRKACEIRKRRAASRAKAATR